MKCFKCSIELEAVLPSGLILPNVFYLYRGKLALLYGRGGPTLSLFKVSIMSTARCLMAVVIIALAGCQSLTRQTTPPPVPSELTKYEVSPEVIGRSCLVTMKSTPNRSTIFEGTITAINDECVELKYAEASLEQTFDPPKADILSWITGNYSIGRSSQTFCEDLSLPLEEIESIQTIEVTKTCDISPDMIGRKYSVVLKEPGRRGMTYKGIVSAVNDDSLVLQNAAVEKRVMRDVPMAKIPGMARMFKNTAIVDVRLDEEFLDIRLDAIESMDLIEE